MKTIHAIFENGVFRPTEPVDLPDNCKVEFEPRPSSDRVGSLPGQDISRYKGILKNLPVDPLEYQRQIREEWD